MNFPDINAELIKIKNIKTMYENPKNEALYEDDITISLCGKHI